MTPAGVRTGLATAVDTISGLRVFDYVPDSLSPPAAVVEPLEVSFHAAMQDGLTMYRAYVLIILGRMSDRSSQDRLDAYVATTGSTSVKAAIEADKTLGGACSTLKVLGATPRDLVVSGVDMIGYRFEVEIYG